MNELESLCKAQLMAIEQIYKIEIQNRDDVARLIGEMAGDKRQVLTICTSLNGGHEPGGSGSHTFGGAETTLPSDRLAEQKCLDSIP